MADKDEIPKGETETIRKQTPDEKERLNQDDIDVPSYRIQLNLDDGQVDRLESQFKLEFDALVKEKSDEGLDEMYPLLDSQYEGDLEPNKALPFNLHVHQSKIKTDAIARGMKEAFLPDNGEVVAVAPRPDSARKDGYIIAEKQTDFIDYVMDEEVKPEYALDRIFKCAIKKFVGIGKLNWAYRIQQRKREETYDGEPQVERVGNRTLVTNEGLDQFMRAYPDAEVKYKGYLKQLKEGKKIDIVVNYKDNVDNNAKLQYVKVEDFYVKNSTDYNEGLRTAHCVCERQTYSYWDLKKKQDEGEFSNIEALWESQDNKQEDGESKEYMVADYKVIEATMMFRLEETDEEIKIKSWFGEDNKKHLGSILYPYYAFDIDYIGFWIELNEHGFFGKGKSVMYTIKDSNIAQNVLLNLALYGLYIRNSITPIVQEGSAAESLLDENRIQAGKPIIVDDLTDDIRKAVGFVQWPNLDMQSQLTLMEMLRRDDSDVMKVSDYTSGRESVVDPKAPASKTIALLQQSGLGIKEYIRTALPCFNIFCTMILQIYYQMSQEGRKYKVRRKSEGITGSDPFGEISRDEMIVKTTVQATAASFVFDKINEKQEAVAAYQIVSENPYAIQNVTLQYEAFKLVLQSFGGKWKALIDKMPDPNQFKQSQMQIALQAMGILIAQAKAQKDNTGVTPPPPTPESMGDTVTKAQAVAYNPSLADPKGAQKK